MPHNILMSKIRCYNSNKKHSAIRNLNYIVYIGTRPGVDLTDVKLDELTAMTEENITPDDPSTNNQYIHYIAKRQNSQGLFGNFNFNNITDVAHEVRDMTDAGVNVYRGIISLSEEDAIELGYNKKAAWVNYMNSVMNDVAERFGIPLTSLRWCAAVHMEQGHPHCHYTFWRTDGKVMSPYIPVAKQNEIREFLSGEMFRAERELLIPEKNKYRDAAISSARSLMDNLNSTFSHIPERITQKQLQPLSDDLLELVSHLPGKGSLKYKFLTPECKGLVNKVVEDIIQVPAVNKEYAAYMKAAFDISKTYSGSEKHRTINMNIADEDIRKRLANSVLKSAATISLVQKNGLPDELSSSPNDAAPYQVNSVHLYDDIKNSITVSAAFSLVYNFLNALNDRRNQDNLLRINSKSKSNSKEARIDAYKKSQEHSSADFER